jgi:hypothetical protein
MRVMPLRSTRLPWWIVAIAAAFTVSACSQEGWKMDWWNQDEKPQTKPRPVAKSQPRPATDSTAAQPRTAAKTETPAEPEDPQSKDVQAKVDRYVQTMNSNPDGSRNYNDFNSKIERQQDPNRKNRLQRVAQQSRETPDAGTNDPTVTGRRPAEPAVKPVADEQPLETPREKAGGNKPAVESPESAGRTTEKASDRASGQPAEKEAAEEDETAAVKANPDEKTASEKRGTREAGSPAASGGPPVLGEITVTPGPEPVAETPKAADEPAKPVPNVVAQPAPEPVDTFQKRLAEQEARVAKEPNNLAEQYKLRMMYLIEGQDEKALSPGEGVDAENQQILQAQVRALISARSSSGRDPAARATELLTPVEELRTQLRARADLQVPKVVLCTDIGGFGVYTPIEPAQFAAGKKNPVVVYIEVDNFKSEKTPSGLHRTLLSLRPSLLNKSGEELWSASHDNIEDLSRQLRHDFFLTLNETLPASLSPGEYTLKIEVEDVLAGKINSNVAKFKIVP